MSAAWCRRISEGEIERGVRSSLKAGSEISKLFLTLQSVAPASMVVQTVVGSPLFAILVLEKFESTDGRELWIVIGEELTRMSKGVSSRSG